MVEPNTLTYDIIIFEMLYRRRGGSQAYLYYSMIADLLTRIIVIKAFRVMLKSQDFVKLDNT